MDSNLMQEKISYAFTLGLQFKENATESESGDNCDENSTIQMNHVPEPSLVYTLKMKHKIDGVDWRRENRWKNVNVQASDGFSLLFHGSLLRQVTDYFLPVSLSTPDAPMEDFYCHSFKKDGLLALYDLIYKGYATIPRNMVIDILIQLSAIDSTLIKQEMFENPDPKDSELKSEKSTIVDRNQIKKRLTFKQRMARLFLSYNKFRPKKKLQMKQKWKVTTIPESSQPVIDYHEPIPSLPLPIIYPQSSSPSSSPHTSTPINQMELIKEEKASLAVNIGASTLNTDNQMDLIEDDVNLQNVEASTSTSNNQVDSMEEEVSSDVNIGTSTSIGNNQTNLIVDGNPQDVNVQASTSTTDKQVDLNETEDDTIEFPIIHDKYLRTYTVDEKQYYYYLIDNDSYQKVTSKDLAEGVESFIVKKRNRRSTKFSCRYHVKCEVKPTHKKTILAQHIAPYFYGTVCLTCNPPLMLSCYGNIYRHIRGEHISKNTNSNYKFKLPRKSSSKYNPK